MDAEDILRRMKEEEEACSSKRSSAEEILKDMEEDEACRTEGMDAEKALKELEEEEGPQKPRIGEATIEDMRQDKLNGTVRTQIQVARTSGVPQRAYEAAIKGLYKILEESEIFK